MNYDIPEWLRYSNSPIRAELLAKRRAKLAKKIQTVVVIGIAIIGIGALLLQPYTVSYETPEYIIPDPCELEVVTCDENNILPHITKTIAYAHVTGYNTVPEQTDSTPCIAASGDDICGRDDVIACPRALPLGTVVEIDGKDYICLDRLAPKYDHRYDISCDKDETCPATVTGYKQVIIKE